MLSLHSPNQATMTVPALVSCLTLYCSAFILIAAASPLSHPSTNSQVVPTALLSPLPSQNHSFPLTVHNYSFPECVSSNPFNLFLADFSYRYVRWPDFPYRYDLPGTQQTQWLQFTDSVPEQYGTVARTLLLGACVQMIDWLRGQALEADIKGWHYVTDDVVHGGGISHSVYFDLQPDSSRRHHLSTRLALDATIAFQELVGRYGALTGRFEIWQFGNLKGVSEVQMIEWPPVRAVDH